MAESGSVLQRRCASSEPVEVDSSIAVVVVSGGGDDDEGEEGEMVVVRVLFSFR